MLSKIATIKPERDFFDHFYISYGNRYAFHTVGKAANSTVKLLLYRHELAGTGLKVPSVHDRAQSPLTSPYQYREADLENVCRGDEFFRFTFVRNPFSRLLSCYLDRIVNGGTRPYRELVRAMSKPEDYTPSFDEFIEVICAQDTAVQNNHWRVQYADAMCKQIDYHFIGKQEEFARDFTIVYKKITGIILPPKILQTNASPSTTSAADRLDQYWTPSLRKLVLDKYEMDFSFFRYSRK